MFWLLVAAHATPLVLPEGPAQLVDVDGDGATDLLLRGGAAVFGDGAGGFGPVTPLHREGEVELAVVGDLDGDGLPEVCGGGFNRTVCRQGQGRSVGAPVFDVPERAMALLVVDADSDGFLDLIRSDTDGLHQHLNDGAGQLSSSTLLAAEPLVDRLLEADVDGDGDLDVVGFDFPYGDTLWWIERLPGGLTTPSVLVANAHDLAQTVFHDIDGDGDPDILFRTGWGSDIRVLERTEGATPPIGYRYGPVDSADTGQSPPDVGEYGSLYTLPHTGPFAVTDLLGVGTPGLVVGEANQLAWAPDPHAPGMPVVSTVHDPEIRAIPQAVPLDGDGRPDLVIVDRDVRAVVDPLGTAATSVLIRGVAEWGLTAIGDIDGDGLADALYTDAQRSVALWMPGTGDGAFGRASAIALPAPAAAASLVDLDHDGAVDVLATTHEGHVVWLAGDGMGAFAPGVELADATPLALARLDIDHDGVDETVVADPTGGVRGLDDDGAGGVQPLAPVGSAGVGLLATGDLDGDGHDDLVGLADPGTVDATVVVFHSRPGGLVLGDSVLAPGLEADAITVGDLDGDGVDSIFVLGACDPLYAYDVVDDAYHYCGSGPRLQQLDVVGGDLMVTGTDLLEVLPPLAIADIDGDGIDDLLGIGDCGGYCRFGYPFVPNDPGSQAVGLTRYPQHLSVGDLDGDGFSDLLIATDEGVHIGWNLTAEAPITVPSDTSDTGDTGMSATPGTETPSTSPASPALADGGCAVVTPSGSAGVWLAPLAVAFRRRRRLQHP